MPTQRRRVGPISVDGVSTGDDTHVGANAEIDVPTVIELRAAIEEAIVLGALLDGTTFMDSSGLAVLASTTTCSSDVDAIVVRAGAALRRVLAMRGAERYRPVDTG